MDRTDFIEQLLVIEDCRTAGEDDDAAAGESTIHDVADSLRRGRNGNTTLLVYFAGCFRGPTVDLLGDLVKPGHPVRIRQRSTAVHLLHVIARVQVVALLELAAERGGEQR